MDDHDSTAEQFFRAHPEHAPQRATWNGKIVGVLDDKNILAMLDWARRNGQPLPVWALRVELDLQRMQPKPKAPAGAMAMMAG